MKFAVCYKGIRKFSGTLDSAIRYLVQQWGSATQAYEIGVRLQQVSMKR